MVDLGKKKGYELVHVMRKGPNIIFVDAPYFSRFGIEDNSAAAMYRPRTLPPGDPTKYPPRKRTLKIDAFEIEKQWIER
jgi:hypothetical protein